MTHSQHTAAGRTTRAQRSAHNKRIHAQAQGRQERERIATKLAAFEDAIAHTPTPTPAHTGKQASKRTMNRLAAMEQQAFETYGARGYAWV